jgi:hypothetical protein
MTGFVLQSILTTDELAYVLQSIDAGLSIELLWDFDSANIDETVFVVTDADSETPTIELKVRTTTYAAISPDARWVHFLFGLTGVNGKRPIFEIETTSRHLEATYLSSWRPHYNENSWDADSWLPADGFTPLTEPRRVRFQFQNAFTQDTVYIGDHQAYRVADFSALAASLVADTSGYVSVSSAADVNGVIGTSPAEDDERERPIGEHDIYGFVLSSTESTDDGGPKRWMVVDCGIHSGEVLDGWPLEGIIDFYVNGVGSQADKIRANWNVGLYFCLTPNGRFGGHMRTNFRSTKDPNRDWGDSGSFALAESVIVRDAILADLDGATEDIGLSLHTASGRDATTTIFRSTDISDQTVQTAWLDNLDTADSTTWTRVDTNINSSVTGWHAARGALVSVVSEFSTRTTASVTRYKQIGQRYLEATALVDAEGLFFQGFELESGSFSLAGGEVTFEQDGVTNLDAGVFTLTGGEVNFEAAIPPTGTVTIGTVIPGVTAVFVPYTYSASDQSGFEARINNGTEFSITDSPAVIAGLTAETAYNSPGVQVRAVNSAGNGSWSTAVSFTTLAPPIPPGEGDLTTVFSTVSPTLTSTILPLLPE